MNWISVKDRLPKDDQYYLTWDKEGDFEVLKYMHKDKFWSFPYEGEYEEWGSEITHWVEHLEGPNELD